MTIKNINTKLYYLVCILILYMFMSNMTGVYSSYLPFHDYLLPATFVLTIIGILNCIISSKVKVDKNIILLISFFTLISIVTFKYCIKSEYSYLYNMKIMVSAILWIFVFL